MADLLIRCSIDDSSEMTSRLAQSHGIFLTFNRREDISTVSIFSSREFSNALFPPASMLHVAGNQILSFQCQTFVDETKNHCRMSCHQTFFVNFYLFVVVFFISGFYDGIVVVIFGLKIYLNYSQF